MNYKEKFIQMNKEARYTAYITIAIIAFWWIMAFGISENAYFLSLPLWFWGACIDTYFFTIILVWLLIKFVFRNFSLDDN